MRLSPNLGGDGTAMRVLLLNHTGSTSQSIFQSDLSTLGLTPQYGGLGNMVPVITANGQVDQRSIWIQVQLVRADGTSVSDWIDEMGIISTAEPATMRLTGDLIRNHLYFATAPGNQYLRSFGTLEIHGTQWVRSRRYGHLQESTSQLNHIAEWGKKERFDFVILYL